MAWYKVCDAILRIHPGRPAITRLETKSKHDIFFFIIFMFFVPKLVSVLSQ